MPEFERIVAASPALVLAIAAAGLLYALGRGAGTRRMRRAFATFHQLRPVVIATLVAVLAANIVVVASFDREPVATAVVLVTTVLAPWLLFLRWLLTRSPSGTERAATQTVLAIGAHPDDIELAVGGTLARFADEGHRVHVIVMSSGEIGGDVDSRQIEASVAGAYLGARTTTVHHFPDTRLETVETEMARVVEETLRELEPDLVLTHSINDQHQDHVAVHRAVARAARRHDSILCFESPSVTRSFNPSVFVDIGRYVAVKAEAINLHHDQRQKPYMATRTVAGIAAFRGQQARVAAAEGFEPLRFQLQPRQARS